MLTPLEIENKKFSKKRINGYSVEEVDEFLDQITADYEKLYKENNELNAKVYETTNQMEHYKSIETTLQSTLVMAQSTAEEIKDVAKKQAEQIVREAENNARLSLEDIKSQIMLKTRELDEAKKQCDVYKAKMEAILISQLELLKDINED